MFQSKDYLNINGNNTKYDKRASNTGGILVKGHGVGGGLEGGTA